MTRERESFYNSNWDAIVTNKIVEWNKEEIKRAKKGEKMWVKNGHLCIRLTWKLEKNKEFWKII